MPDVLLFFSSLAKRGDLLQNIAMRRKSIFAALTENEKTAWEMRVAGKTDEEIAQRLGISPDVVGDLVKEAEKKMRGVRQIMTIKTEVLLEEEERKLKALKLRLQGKLYDEIARLCKFPDAQKAKDAVMEAIKQAPEPVKEEIRRVDIARLDELYQVAYAKAVQTGDPRAVNACLNIIERRWKLFNIATENVNKTADDLRRRLEDLPDEALIEIIERGLEMRKTDGNTGNADPAN